MFQGRRIITMVISLLVAILFWLYVVTIIAPEVPLSVDDITISIDGTFVLQERELIITQRDVKSLNLELTTLRVNSSKLNRDTIRINADASKIREPGTYKLPCEVTFPDTVRSSDVDIRGKSVDYVTITVSRLQRKAFQIEPNWIGSPGEDYLFDQDSAVLEPASVEVYGPEEEIAQIAKVTVDYDVTGLTETVFEKNVQLHFLDENGEEITFSELTVPDLSQVNLTVPVYRTREIKLKVEFTEGGGVTAENASVTLTPASIRVKGPSDIIESLDEEFVVGTVDLSAVPDSNEQELVFPLNLPAGVNTMRTGGEETEVKATILLTGVSTEKIKLYDVRLVNVPADLEIVNTKTVEVTVRGKTEEIKQIKANKENGIYVTVDLKEYTQPGAFTLSGQVVNEAHPDLSVVEKTVKIDVILSQPAEPEVPIATDKE